MENNEKKRLKKIKDTILNDENKDNICCYADILREIENDKTDIDLTNLDYSIIEELEAELDRSRKC